MEKILLFIKHHFSFLWRLIEWVNGLLFSVLYGPSMERILPGLFREKDESSFIYRRLKPSDAEALYDLIHSQESSDLAYFSPHGFDLSSIKKQFKNRSFLMMGVFDQEQMVGYFFLRFFANKKCFVGRLIDRSYRGKMIGKEMNRVMYETAWGMGFRCLSTMSRNNKAVMHSHSKNANMRVLKDLQNDYILVEFVKGKPR